MNPRREEREHLQDVGVDMMMMMMMMMLICECADCIQLSGVRAQFQALVNTRVNLRIA